MLNLESPKCKFSVKDSKLTIEGKCADKLSKADSFIFRLSQILGKEMSIYKCVDPDTGKVKRIVFDTIGTPTSTRLTKNRVCATDEAQHSLHTHPQSGVAKFSEADRHTLNYRLENNMDNCGCVSGQKETRCLCEFSYERNSEKV